MEKYTLSKESQERWAAFWEFDMADRPVLLTGYRKDPHDPVRELPDIKAPEIPLAPPTDPEKLRQYNFWFSIDDQIRKNLWYAANYMYSYEFTMQFDTNWSVAYCLPFGVHASYNEYAAWCDPETPVTCADEFVYNYDGAWNNWLCEGTRKIAEAGKDLYYITPVMWGNHSGDTLSNLVGLDQLMIDCIENPDSVIRALNAVTDAQIATFAKLREYEKLTNLPGTRNYTSTWSPKVGLSFDCDVSAMVSPEMFNKIFLPPLVRMMETVDHRIYHLDGPVCLQHLPTLLSLPQLHAIQWVCGAGNEGLERWYDLYERIQAAKKSVILYVGYDQVLDVCKRLNPRGLAIHFHSPSEEKMHEMVEKVASLYR